MTGREKLEAAFSPSGSPEIPIVVSCYEDIYCRDHWDDLSSYPWWYSISPDLDQQMRWRREVISAGGEDWFRLPFCPARDDRCSTVLEPTLVGVRRTDQRTGRTEDIRKPPINGWPELDFNSREHLAQTQAEIDDMVPVPDSDPQAVMAEGRNDLALRLLAEFGSCMWANHRTESPLASCGRLWGFEGLMTMIAVQPNLVHYGCQRFLARAKHRVAEAAVLGADVIWIVDCFTDLISPAAFAALNVPYMIQLVKAVRTAGIKSIYYFTGNPGGKWDLMLAIGADAIAVEEGKKGFTNDIEAIAACTQGRCTLFGNLDPVGILQNGSEAQLRDEVARQTAAGRRNGSRFVMSIGSPVTAEMSVRRVRLFCDMARELGRS